MFAKLTPDAVFYSVTDIGAEFLRESGIAGIALDVDNTIARYSETTPGEDIIRWCEALKEDDIRFAVVSNNRHEHRVKAISGAIGVPFILSAKKPGRRGFEKAAELMSLPAGKVLAVGDQIFTDVLGAKRAGMKAAIVYPLGMGESFLFRIRRALEMPFIGRCKAVYSAKPWDNRK